MKLNKFLVGVMSLVIGAASVSCNDDDNYYINTSDIISEVTTGNAETTATTATINGTVKDLSSQSPMAYTVGVIYGTDEQSLLTGGTRRGGELGEDGYTVTTTLTGLNDGVTYYYATFVTLQNKYTEFGEVKAFVTTDSQMGTAEPASVAATSVNLGATLNGVNDLLEGGMEHGIIITATPEAIADGVKLPSAETSNSYTVVATGLVPNATYYYAAYMVLNEKLVVDENVKSVTMASFYDPENEESELYVDMGLPYDWATCNIGAENPAEVGGLYGFGDATGINHSDNVADYATTAVSGTDADIAKAAGAGLIPTEADWNTLLSNSDVEMTTVDGVEVAKVTSRLTGNSIILPVAGSRDGESVSANGGYWTGDVASNHADYAKMMVIKDGITADQASRHIGLAVRPIRKAPYRAPKIDNAKIAFGDLEENGRIRIEIYNEYGSTGANPPLNTALVDFSKNMQVVFRISGLTGAAASGTYSAGLSYASADWSISTWGESSKVDVHGDGVYTLSWNATGHCIGAVVWCIDIEGLGAAIGDDKSGLKCEILSISLDDNAVEFVGKNLEQETPAVFSTIDNSKIATGDLENNGKYRIEIYNEFGNTKNTMPIDLSLVNFSKKIDVTFTLDGINGAAVGKDYTAGLSFAAASWDPSTWGEASQVTVNGDGTYTLSWVPSAECIGAVVWCIDIDGLSADLADVNKVTANIVSIVLDNGAVVFRGQGTSKETIDNSKLSAGDLENNGNYRIELYNEYGNTKADSPIDLSKVNFSEKLEITFSVSGINGAAAGKSYNAALSYAAASWDPSTWGEKSVAVNGDGTYTVAWDAPGLCEGAVVWCIDIQGMSADLQDVDAVSAKIESIVLDNGKVVFLGK
ncbi:MAG: hypothetical protein K2J65_09795 [Duncaniella sp.]|nr:hypothetical protein [Duncaniella sp.]